MDPALATVLAAIVAASALLANTVLAARQNRKINETHKQVTENHHSNDKPTLLDLLDDVRTDIAAMDQKLDTQEQRFDLHLLHSDSLERRLIRLEAHRIN